MENPIRKHIDSLKNSRVKKAMAELPGTCSGLEKTEYKEEFVREYDYEVWLGKTMSKRNNNSVFPVTIEEVDLYDLLLLEVLYKQNFKLLCDSEHPVIYDLLGDLGLTDKEIVDIVSDTKSFSLESLDYYVLFLDELLEGKLSLDLVNRKIDQLAEDCSQGCPITHSAKMTNPACKYPKLFATANRVNDGFIKTGNISAEFDMHINAPKLKVFKFFSLKYKSVSILDHVKSNINVFTELFSPSDQQAEKWMKLFSACASSFDLRSDRLIKQSYFPVKNEYHLLSYLQPSGIVFALKQRIDSINDRSVDSYLGKRNRKDNKYSKAGYSTIVNLTVTKHGGDHPKNISGLNNKYQNYYLLNALPPSIEKRTIRFPRKNFFTESFRYWDCQDIFQALHKIFRTDYNNKRIREGRDYRLQDMMSRIIARMWAVRGVEDAQYQAENSQLKAYQKIWLLNENFKNREDSDKWLDELCQEISVWAIKAYEKVLGKQALKLGEVERLKIKQIINQNREALR